MLPQLEKYDMYVNYKLCAISHAAGILANRKKSIKRGLEPRRPYAKRMLLTAYHGFKIESNTLKVPLGNRQYFGITLNSYVGKLLAEPSLKIRSFLLIVDSVSICYSKEVVEIECSGVKGVDRNLRNITVGNGERIVQYNLSKAVDIAENTRSIVRSFKRNDVRVKKKLASKYGHRRRNRINQLMHHVSKTVVKQAVTRIAGPLPR